MIEVKLQISSLFFNLFWKIIFRFVFGCAGSLLLHGLFCSCGEWGLLSSCVTWASDCGGLSCCGLGL